MLWCAVRAVPLHGVPCRAVLCCHAGVKVPSSPGATGPLGGARAGAEPGGRRLPPGEQAKEVTLVLTDVQVSRATCLPGAGSRFVHYCQFYMVGASVLVGS